MKKRVLAVVLSILMLLTVFPYYAFAEGTSSETKRGTLADFDITWSDGDNKTLNIEVYLNGSLKENYSVSGGVGKNDSITLRVTLKNADRYTVDGFETSGASSYSARSFQMIYSGGKLTTPEGSTFDFGGASSRTLRVYVSSRGSGYENNSNLISLFSGNVYTYSLFEGQENLNGVSVSYSRAASDGVMSGNYAATVNLYLRDSIGGGSPEPTATAYAYNLAFRKNADTNVLTLGGNYWFCVDYTGGARGGIGNTNNTVVFSSGVTSAEDAVYNIYAYPLDIPMTNTMGLVTVSQKSMVTDNAEARGAKARRVEVYFNGDKVDEVSCGGSNTVFFAERGDGMNADDIVVNITNAGKNYIYQGVSVDSESKTYKINFATKTRITYEPNGGGGNPTEREYTGKAIVGENLFTHQSKSFAGWNTSRDGSGDTYLPGDTFSGSSSVVLYAIWQSPSYTVTLVTNGADSCRELTEYTSGVETILPVPQRNGYIFGGWYTDQSFSGSAVTSIGAEESGNKAYYAKWIENRTYRVTFDEQNGSQPISSDAGAGSKLTRPSTPVREEYTFVAWYTDTGYTNIWDFSYDTVSSDVTLYAKWTQNYSADLASARNAAVNAIQSSSSADTAESKTALGSILVSQSIEEIEILKKTALRQTSGEGGQADTLKSVKDSAIAALKSKAGTGYSNAVQKLIDDYTVQINTCTDAQSVYAKRDLGLTAIDNQLHLDRLNDVKSKVKSDLQNIASAYPDKDTAGIVSSYSEKIDAADSADKIYAIYEEGIKAIYSAPEKSAGGQTVIVPGYETEKADAKSKLKVLTLPPSDNMNFVYGEYAGDIDAATGIADIDKIILSAEKTVDSVNNGNGSYENGSFGEKIEESIAEAKKAITEAAGDDPSDEIKSLVDQIYEQLNNADNENEVSSICTEGLAVIQKQRNAELLRVKKKDVIDALERRAGSKRNRTEEIQKFVDDAISAINNCESLDELETVSKEISKAYSILSGEDLETEKKKAIESIETLTGYEISADQKKIAEEAKKRIEQAETVEDIRAVMNDLFVAFGMQVSMSKEEAREALDKADTGDLTEEEKEIIADAKDQIENEDDEEKIASITEQALVAVGKNDTRTLGQKKVDATESLMQAAGEKKSTDMAKAVDKALKAVYEAKTDEELFTALEEGRTIIADLKAAEELLSAKEAMISEIREAAGDDPSDDMKKALEETIERIRSAESLDELSEMRNEIISLFEDSLVSEELNKARDDAKRAINRAIEGYDSENIRSVVDGEFAKIDSALSIEEIESVKEAAFETLRDAIIAEYGAKDYRIISGLVSEWINGTNGDITLVSDIESERFLYLTVDGDKTVSGSCSVGGYNIEATFFEGYLKTLRNGKHEIKFVAIDGDITAEIVIGNNERQSVFESPVFWICLGGVVLAGAGVATFFLIRRKKESEGVFR